MEKDTNKRMRELGLRIEETEGRKRVWWKGVEVEKEERELKKEVERENKKKALEKWKREVEKKKSLKYYKKKEGPRKMEIYDGSWGASLLFKARTNSLEVNERKKRWGEEKEICEGCGKEGEREIETLEHVLIECEGYERERKRFEKEIEEVIGREVWEEEKKGENGGMEVILGLKEEKREILIRTKKYIENVWNKRRKRERMRRERGEREREGREMRYQGGDHNYQRIN